MKATTKNKKRAKAGGNALRNGLSLLPDSFPSRPAATPARSFKLRGITSRKQAELSLVKLKAQLERRLAEQEARLRKAGVLLRSSEKRLRQFIEHAPVALAMFDRDMRYLAASQRWLRAYGVKKSKIIGRSHYELFPELPERWKNFFKHGLAGEILHEEEDCFERPDGTQQWLRWDIRPWFDADGAVGGIVIFTEDITDRKREQEAVARSEQLFRLLFETMVQGVMFQDAEGRVLVMNTAAEHILGWTLAENFLGATRRATEHPILREDGTPFSETELPSTVALKNGREVRDMVMGVFNPREKAYRWIHISAVPVFLQGTDKPQQVYTVFNDITSRRESEAALKQSADALKQAQHLAGVGNWEWNIATGRHAWSEQIYHIYGRDPSLPPAVYPEVKKYFTSESWARLAAAVDMCLHDGQKYQCDAEVVASNGEHRWITARGDATRDATGKIVELHGTVQDITERKRTEELLQRANRTLHAVHACNEAMLRTQSEIELLHEVCRIIVKTGGERMAWVGYAEGNRGKLVRPVAHAGFSRNYVRQARITWADTPRGHGPVGTAVRTGRICICQNTLTDPNFTLWREFARQCGYGSVIALPLKEDGRCFGALCIYAPNPDVFDAGEQQLLTDLANDLSFGITTLRLRAERERLENEILHSIEREQERIGRDLHDGLCQLLVGAKYRSVYLEKILEGIMPEAAEEARSLEVLLNQATEQARDLARGLNPVKATVNGLELALQGLADQVAMEKDHGPHCFCHFPRPVRITDHQTANHLYRIAQEAVQNAVKHAAAKNISITLLRLNRELRLIVKDDGRGIPVNYNKTGMGLDNMHTRAALIGGALEIRRRKHGGTAVTCSVASPPTKTKL